jgi:hypothetical protein
MNLYQALPLSNKNILSKQCCSHCGKTYKTRTNLDKHLLLCELIHKRKSSNISYNEEDVIPSQKIMYELLLELGQKYVRLEEKVDEISKLVIKKKKKINILEWLNGNITPNIIFDKLSEKISIDEDDIEFLFYNSFLDTLNIIFMKSIYLFEDNENPIFAFSQNNNIFYIFDKLSNNNTWCELSREKLIRFLNIIQMKISKKLYEWKKTHSQKIKEDDNLLEIHDKAVSKLMSIEFKQESLLVKIKSIMYNKMKKDVKALIEYEFEF